jgi:hypothetical protein
MGRPIGASRFFREILTTPGLELFAVEGEVISPWLVPGEEIDLTIFDERTGFVRVPDQPRPLQILADEGKSWLAFRYHRRTGRVATSMLLANVARTLNAIAVFRESEEQS